MARVVTMVAPCATVPNPKSVTKFGGVSGALSGCQKGRGTASSRVRQGGPSAWK